MDKIKSLIQNSIAAKQQLLQDEKLLQTIEKCSQIIVEAYRNNKRLYLCGNGGSASDAQHIAAELTGRFYKNRIALPAEALHCNTSYLTAVANDFGYDDVYSRMIEGTTNPGDVLIAISTSGNSSNIVKAVEMAREKKVVTIGFTGQKGGKMTDLCDYLINVPSNDTPRIQECHILIGHIICQIVEEQYFG